VLIGPAPKACSQLPSSDARVSTDHSTLPEKKRRMFCGDGTSVEGGVDGATCPKQGCYGVGAQLRRQ
jgi:hypothetical protein